MELINGKRKYQTSNDNTIPHSFHCFISHVFIIFHIICVLDRVACARRDLLKRKIERLSWVLKNLAYDGEFDRSLYVSEFEVKGQHDRCPTHRAHPSIDVRRNVRPNSISFARRSPPIVKPTDSNACDPVDTFYRREFRTTLSRHYCLFHFFFVLKFFSPRRSLFSR